MAEARDYGKIIVLTGAGASAALGLHTMASFPSLVESAGGTLRMLVDNMPWRQQQGDLEYIYERLELYIEAGRCGSADADRNLVEAFGGPQRGGILCTRATEALGQLQELMLSSWGHVDGSTHKARSFSEGLQTLLDANEAALSIFTTNYDLTFEDLPAFGIDTIVNGLRRRGLEYAYVWDPSVYGQVPRTASAVIYRLHGCSHWFQDSSSRDILYQTNPEVARRGLRPMVVFPAQGKGDQALEAVFAFAYEEFRRALTTCRVCLVIGSSLRDAAVVNAMATAPEHVQFIVVDDGLDTGYIRDRLGNHRAFHVGAKFGMKQTHWFLLHTSREALHGRLGSGFAPKDEVMAAYHNEHREGPEPAGAAARDT